MNGNGVTGAGLGGGAGRIIWKSAGLHLVERDAGNHLKVTPDLIRAYLTRPEIHPVEESCANEHRLFEALMAEPARPVSEAEITAIADPDTASNYRILLRFRDHLLASGTVEKAYLALFSGGKPIEIPPVFIEQMVHLILTGMLRGEDDPFIARAAEILFRDQAVTTTDGQLMFADAEVVEMYSKTGGFGGLGNLLAEAGTPMRQVSLDVLTEENSAQYWGRADHFNFALDFRYTQPGPDALGNLMSRWIRHFLGVETRIQAMQSIRDERWSWHVGLDAESTNILNALYEGRTAPEVPTNRLATLYRLEFAEPGSVRPAMRGKAVYLGLAVNEAGIVRMKPQNLLVNLPLVQAS